MDLLLESGIKDNRRVLRNGYMNGKRLETRNRGNHSTRVEGTVSEFAAPCSGPVASVAWEGVVVTTPAIPLARRLLLLGMVWLAGVSLVASWASAQVAPTRPADRIGSLIDQLNAEQYQQREQAMTELISMGGAALRPLAYRYFGAPPESAWRIKKTLQAIGTENDDPEVCFKAIGILIVLDRSLGDGVVQLLNEWREKRSEKALNHLVSLGAQVRYELDGMIDPALGMQIQFREVIIEDMRMVDEAEPVEKSKPQDRKRYDPREAFALVNEVLNGSPEENEEFVWSRYREITDSSVAAPSPSVGGQLILRGGQLGFGGVTIDRPVVILHRDWAGTDEDFRRLAHIHNLMGLRMVNRNVSEAQAEVIEGLQPMQILTFERCQFVEHPMTEIQLPPGLVRLELSGQSVDRATGKWLAQGNVASLVLNDCEIDSSFGTALSDAESLQSIRLSRVAVPGELFAGLAKLPNLSALEFSVAKFSPENLRAFQENRPGVMVNFAPVAFLGVQAPTALNRYSAETECLIDSVVDGSSAARGGVLPGDVIRKVDGHAIERFEELRMFISQHDVDDELELEIDRGGRKLNLKVRLGSIEEAPLR